MKRMTTIGVNAYLWRAALDTLSFAPLAQSDSTGGVRIWDRVGGSVHAYARSPAASEVASRPG